MVLATEVITSNFDLQIDTSHPYYTMKFFLLALALAAVSAEPESKPYYGYGGYGGYGLGYGGYGRYLGKRSADAEPEADPLLVGYYPYGNGYALPTVYYGYHLIGKRSADAEPESKPYYYGGLYGGYGGLYGGNGHYLGKRSADAESKPYYYGGLYGGYGLGYGYGGYLYG